MKLDEELWPDRVDGFQTDDEENEAETACDEEGDSESDNSESPSCKMDNHNPIWPQSYRQSVDMLKGVTPPSISFTRRNGSAGFMGDSFLKKLQNHDPESSLGEPLIANASLDQEEVPTSTLTSSQVGSVGMSVVSNELLLHPQNQQCSFQQAILNGINVICGVGLLTTPYAVKEGGWFSLLILLIFGIIACYTGFLLKRCLESSPGLHTYPDIGQAAFGRAGRLAIAITLYVELYAACVEFITMLSDNLSAIFPTTHVDIAGMCFDAHQTFSMIGALLVLPTVWLRDLSLLSYLSVGGVGASILVVLCLLWVGVVDKIGFHSGGTALDLANASVSIGIYGFCYSGHSVFPNIYSSMKDPSRFTLVLIISFTFCWFMYCGAAICGFLIFGDSIESQFTLNMPTQFAASKMAVWTAVICPMTKYALTLTPIALSLEELIPSGRCFYGVSVLIRTVLVFSTLIVARTVPFFGFVMALIGSILAMLAAFIFPCACYLRIRRGSLNKSQIIACIFIIVIGVLSAWVGTYSSIARIARELA